MYLEHFGLTEAPFKITPHTEFFFSGANRGETLEALLYSITSGEGIVKVTGEVGSGKTMLCRVLMERLPDTVEIIYLAVPSLSRDEMLATIAGDLNIETLGLSTTKLIRALQEKLINIHAEGRQVVALIDEAHAMPLETLEEIRLLSNLETSHFKLMQIVLFGQPELDQHLSLQTMRQLRERITHSFNLLPLPPRDIKDYVDFRLRAAGYKGPELFTPASLKLIAEASEGLTRRINIYCDKTLLAAFAAGTYNVTPDLVQAAITDTQIVAPESAKKRGMQWLGIAAGLLAGMVIGFLAGRLSAPTTFSTVASGSVNAATVTAQPLSPPPSIALGASSSTAAQAPDAKVGVASVATVTATLPTTPTTSTTPTTPATLSETALAMANITEGSTAIAAANIAKDAAPPKSDRDWLATRAAADLERLKKLPNARFAIQLMTADERERGAIENFLRAASRELNPDRIMLYRSGTVDNPKISVLYGNYTERNEAAAELSGLPSKVTKFRPYVRSLQAVRDDLRAP
jgi:type II secretory pathway predicted ATPase ExeA/septal ring-binding cell division protein DamX